MPDISDKTYSRIHWTCMIALALLALNGFVLKSFIPMPHNVGLRMVVAALLVFNILWWSIADRRLARYVSNTTFARTLRIATFVFSVTMTFPLLYMIWRGHIPQLLLSPLWYAAAITLWNIGLAVLLPPVALLRLLGLGSWRIAQWVRGASTQPQSVNESRRALLRTSVVTLPVLALTGATLGSVGRQNQFLVRRKRLDAPWLPDRLKGLTITQISDLHVGRLYRPEMLPRLIDAVNELNSDVLLVTGDLVDNSNDMLPPTLDALGHMSSRHGMYISIGNHDMIDDRAEFIRQTRGRFPLLINERAALQIGGEKLCIAGLDYANSDDIHPGRPSHPRYVAQMLADYEVESEGPVIVMAHHPHAWDWLQPRGVPLTLSGHTHGGQFMFTPAGSGVDLGLGQILFRYIRGYYQNGPSLLYVNSGVGNWFPMRINAPAEIIQFQLT